MNRFFTLLLLFFFFQAQSQNLIPNPGADDFLECPETLGYGLVPTPEPDSPPALDGNVLHWKTYAGSPDYYNVCSSVMGSSNLLGYQEPLSGTGYLGVATYFFGLPDYREYVGVELTEPLEVGETYYISFHASWSFEPTAGFIASNRLGVLLMAENYLPLTNGDSSGINYSNFSTTSILADTTNWQQISFQFFADSAYTQIVFGNFFDDSSTDTIYPYISNEGGAFANYFLDDFCVAKDSAFCPGGLLHVKNTQGSSSLSLFPNPCGDFFNYKSEQVLRKIEICSPAGIVLSTKSNLNNFEGQEKLDLNPGLYFGRFYTEEGVLTKRFVVR